MTTGERLDVHLARTGLFESRAKAAAAVEAGLVTVDGGVVLRPGARLPQGAAITVADHRAWAGRGALKLLHALDLWPISVAERVCLDVGASTGGFTEVLLSRGAARVYAVDVGRGQLHPRLAADPRVISLEGVDARRLDGASVPEPISTVVCDASFIGLAKVLGPPLALAEAGADLVALVKPQFEVGPERVGKGGLVRDPSARAEAVQGARSWIESQGWTVLGQAESPITGGDGALEFLLHGTKKAARVSGRPPIAG